MTDKTDKLAQQGTFLLVLVGVLTLVNFLTLNSMNAADDHLREARQKLEDGFKEQAQAIDRLSGEVRRLQEQRRIAEDLRAALAEHAARTPAPVYMQPAPLQAPAQPQTQQPQTQTPQTQQPQTPQTQQPPAEETPPATQGGGEAGLQGSGLGTDDRMPGPDPDAVVGDAVSEAHAEVSTLNLYTTSEGQTRQFMRNIIEPFFMLSESDPTQLTPLLAERWAVGEDKLTYTYWLRKGVTWTDGAPFSADDVLFTYDTIMDKEVESEAYKGSFSEIESFTKVDDYTVQVKYKRPYWPGLYLVGNSFYVIPKHWYQKKIREQAEKDGISTYSVEPGQPGFGALFNKIQEPCVGTGPYYVPEGGWVRGTSLTFLRNPNYWRHEVEPGVFNLEKILVRFISDQQAQLNQLRNQKIDVLVVKKDTYEDSLSKEPAIRDNFRYYTYDHVGLGYNFIVWNCRKFPFDDARVRRAMTHCVDREGMLRDLWRNNGVVATCTNKPIYPEYNKKLQPLAFDRRKAAALLAEAGFKDLDGDGILDKVVDGQQRQFAFILKVPSGIPEYEQIGNKVKESLEKIGVKVTIQPLEWSVFIKQLDDLDFEAMCLYNSFTSPWIDNYESYHSSEAKPRGGNIAGLAMPELDQLLTDCRQEFDREKRIPMYHRIYELVHEQQPMTLLIHGRVNVLLHKRFRNVIVRHAGMRQTYWWVDPKDWMYR